MFICKLNSLGSFIWAKGFGGRIVDYGKAITTNASGDVFCVGEFHNTVDFDPGSGTNFFTSLGFYDLFISKFDVNGNYQWTKVIGNQTTNYIEDVEIDGSGNILISGVYADSGDFNPSSNEFKLVSKGLYDVFLVKLDPVGSFLWAKSIGEYNRDDISEIKIDKSGNIYMVGDFVDKIDCNPSADTNLLVSKALTSLFLCKFNSSGNYIWARVFGDMLYNGARGLSIDDSENILVSGYFQGDSDFNIDTGVLVLSTNVGVENSFIVKLNNCFGKFDTTYTISNSTIIFNQQNVSYQWYDCTNGNSIIAGANSKSYSPPKSGKYSCKLSSGYCEYKSQCIDVVKSNIVNSDDSKTNFYFDHTNSTYIIDCKLKVLSYDIVDISGRIITHELVNKTIANINSKNLVSGIYFLIVEDENQKKSIYKMKIEI